MTKTHQSDAFALWSLEGRTALTLRIGAGGRALQVMHGRLWLTSTRRGLLQSADIWLVAGEGLHLPAGSEVVIEAWPVTRFELLVPPSSSLSERWAGTSALRRGWRGLVARAQQAVGAGSARLLV